MDKRADTLDIRFVASNHPDLIILSGELDAFYVNLFGDIYRKYQSHNTLTGLTGAAIAYEGNRLCGCCCWRPFDQTTAEIKRMFVRSAARRNGVARHLIQAIEQHAIQNGYRRAVLETAQDTPEAIAFYQAVSYRILPEGYGIYRGNTDCVCFEKIFSDKRERNRNIDSKVKS